MVFDAHAHVIVPELLRDAAPEEDWRPRVSWEDGKQHVEHGGKRIASAVREFVDADRILAEQDAVGIDRILLCPWVALLAAEAPVIDAERMLGVQNDGLAALAAAHPDRIAVLGGVPLQDSALAARELEALVRRAGFAGVEVPASVGGRYLGDDRFRPFWAAAEETGALVFVHPTTRGFDAPAFGDYYLWNTVGNPLETTITAAHMACAGVLEAHPGLRVLLAHGGGAVLALRGRLRHAWTFQPQARARLGRSPEESLGRFYYDTVVYDEEVLRGLVSHVGADRVLLGSDYPFDMADVRPHDHVRALGLPGDDEARILGGNAVALVGEGAP